MKKNFKDNLQDVEKLLTSHEKNVLPHFINGQSTLSQSGLTFDNYSPIDNKKIGAIASGDKKDIDIACEAAFQAFGEWRNTSGKIRKKLLHKVADGIEKYARDIALIESYDSGQAIRYMSKAAIRGAANFRFFSAARDGKHLKSSTLMNITTRVPIGPVGIITPWNTPFMLSTWKIAPALASGCTVVHKPAEWSPYTALMLAEIAHDAGLPDGVLNCVQGLGETAGRALTENKHIKAIAFVGESSTGSQIMKQGADTLKRFHFELGGKNPVIVFDDADLDKALDAANFYSSGQICSNGTRVFVHKDIKQAFLSRLIARLKQAVIGDPLDEATNFGPMVSQRQMDIAQSYITKGHDEGARLVYGGSRLAGDGFYLEPTVFADVTDCMTIAQEEIFGPVMSVFDFEDEADVISRANATEFGLSAGVFTRDISRAYLIN